MNLRTEEEEEYEDPLLRAMAKACKGTGITFIGFDMNKREDEEEK